MWALLALASAFCLSVSDVFAKRALGYADPWSVGWVKFAGAAVVAAPFLLGGTLPAPWPFGGYLLVIIPLELLAIYGYHRAIAGSPLSLSVPMLAFTPVFLLVVGRIVLGEVPSARGYAGVGCVAAGAYWLHVVPGAGFLAPLRSIWREPGSRIMLGVALLYSITASLGKKLVMLSSPGVFGALYPLLLAAALSPLMAAPERRLGLRRLPLGILAGIAITYGAMVLFHFAAIAQAPAAYMIAVKRTSLLFAVVWGALFFGEPAPGRRAAAAALMLAGVALLSG